MKPARTWLKPANYVISSLAAVCQRAPALGIALALAAGHYAPTQAWGPAAAAAGAAQPQAREERAAARPAGAGLQALVRWYQRFISPVDGDRCGMEPSCSVYAAEAVRQRGALAGLPLAFDRLMRDNGQLDRDRPAVLRDGRWRVRDPLADNLKPRPDGDPEPPVRWPAASRAPTETAPAPDR